MARLNKIPSLETATLVRDSEELGAALRARRKELGYTQEWCAKMLGFSPRLVGEIERGRGTVAFDKVLWYAKNLGMDIILDRR